MYQSEKLSYSISCWSLTHFSDIIVQLIVELFYNLIYVCGNLTLIVVCRFEICIDSIFLVLLVILIHIDFSESVVK